MPNRRLTVRAVLTVSLVVATAGALAGCLSQNNPAEPPPLSSPSAPAPTSSTLPGPSSSPSETTVPVEQPTPVSIPCASVVDAQTMYDYNPNYGLLNSFEPASNTLAARAIQDHGTACRWMNQTSNITIDIAISQPGPTAFSAAKSSAKSGTSVSGLGDAAYFSVAGGVGTVQAFTGKYWVSGASASFASPGDATTLMKKAVASAH